MFEEFNSRFDFEELYMINNFVSGNPDTEKSTLINRILIAIAATPSEELKESLKVIYKKVYDMNTEEYSEFMSHAPFDTPFANEEDEDTDEYEEYSDWNEQDVEEFTELILAFDKATEGEE